MQRGAGKTRLCSQILPVAKPLGHRTVGVTFLGGAFFEVMILKIKTKQGLTFFALASFLLNVGGEIHNSSPDQVSFWG